MKKFVFFVIIITCCSSCTYFVKLSDIKKPSEIMVFEVSGRDTEYMKGDTLIIEKIISGPDVTLSEWHIAANQKNFIGSRYEKSTLENNQLWISMYGEYNKIVSRKVIVIDSWAE